MRLIPGLLLRRLNKVSYPAACVTGKAGYKCRAASVNILLVEGESLIQNEARHAIQKGTSEVYSAPGSSHA